MREGRAGGRANEQAHSLSLSLSRTLVTPTTSTPPWRGITRAAFSPLCSISRQPIWAGTRNDKFTRRSRDPPPRGRNADTPRHNSKDQSLSKSQIHLKHLVTCEREILCSFELLLLGLPFFFSHSYSQVLCKQGKRHQGCGGPCGVLLTRAIKEEGSLGLSDRLREGKG
jgi:hypothetical protein